MNSAGSNRGGGGKKKGGGGGGSRGGSKGKHNNVRGGEDNVSTPDNVTTTMTTEQSNFGDQSSDNNNSGGGGGDVVVVELDRSGSDSSNNSSGGTAIFNSFGEEEEEEHESSVVNASLIVNLSNANVSEMVEEEDFKVEKRENEGMVGLSESLIEGNAAAGGGGVMEEEEEDLSEESTLADSEVEKLMMTMMSGRGGISSSGVVEGLPSTVSVLKAPNGVVCYLVGTAHFSEQSQVDVVQTIQKTHPTLVLLELCSSRRNILSLDEETVLKEVSEMSFQKIRLALSNSGTVQGTLHLLLLSMSAQLTKKLGMAPGGEFRAAMREARKIPGCVLLLGDRPFNITISRALAALTFTQKIKLAWQFLTCNEDITREEIEKCKEKDLLERMLTEMTGEFPSITEVFVNERDVYLAHSLFLAATSDAHRSNGGPIVGVVGMGHVPGIVKNWGKTSDEGVNEIVRIPETPISSIIIRKVFKFGFYGVMAYGVFRVSKRVGFDWDVLSRRVVVRVSEFVKDVRVRGG